MKRALPLVLAAALCLCAQVQTSRYCVAFCVPTRRARNYRRPKVSGCKPPTWRIFRRWGATASLWPPDRLTTLRSISAAFSYSRWVRSNPRGPWPPKIQRFLRIATPWTCTPGWDLPILAWNIFGCISWIQARPEYAESSALSAVSRTGWEEKRSTRDQLLVAHARYLDQLRGSANWARRELWKHPTICWHGSVRPVAFDEAQQLFGADSAVQAGVVRADFHAWWSSDHVLPW